MKEVTYADWQKNPLTNLNVIQIGTSILCTY